MFSELCKPLSVAGLVLLLVGCGKEEDSVGTLPPVAPLATQVDIGGAAPNTVPAPVVAPPTDGGQLAPAAINPPAAMNDGDLLGGNGRPLTEEEKMLISYGVSMFKDEKGRYPANLQEAVASRHVTRLPKLPAGEEFNYDPQTGQVTVIKK